MLLLLQPGAKVREERIDDREVGGIDLLRAFDKKTEGGDVLRRDIEGCNGDRGEQDGSGGFLESIAGGGEGSCGQEGVEECVECCALEPDLIVGKDEVVGADDGNGGDGALTIDARFQLADVVGEKHRAAGCCGEGWGRGHSGVVS